MKNIWEKIKAFFKALDKQIHILICYAIPLTVFIFFAAFSLNWLGFAMAIIVAEVCAIGRELLGKWKPEKYSFEWADLIADQIGILLSVGTMLFYLLN